MVEKLEVFVKRVNLENPSHVCVSHGFLQNLRNAKFWGFLQPKNQQIELPVGAHQLPYILDRHLCKRVKGTRGHEVARKVRIGHQVKKPQNEVTKLWSSQFLVIPSRWASSC